MWRTAESLNELKEEVRTNGFPIPVTLAIHLVSFRCNLHDGKHMMTSATKLNLMWIPIRVLRLSLGLANKVLRFLNLSLICRVHVNKDLLRFRAKKAKTIVSIVKVCEKLIHVVKMLASICPKYMQFRLKEKKFHHQNFSSFKVSSSKKKSCHSCLRK